ncbi:MAG: ABC transporter substrate-binding protein [Actinomycetota bacterium]
MKRALVLVLALALLGSACSSGADGDPIRVGAIYPLSGSQGQGGIDEHRGVMLAADLVNDDGGVDGRPIAITSLDVAGGDAAPAAVSQLDDAGIDLVLGSYGSTISAPGSEAAAGRGMLFWETGAVGMLTDASDRGELTFRVPPTGGTLGRAAIDFVNERFAPELDDTGRDLSYAVAYVDDVYGRSVAQGAFDRLDEQGLRTVGRFPYDFRTADYDALAKDIGASGADVLFVSAYLEDGIALRRALVRNHVHLVTSIGTSSSYCMPEFGETLGRDAVGLFASDKPAGGSIDPEGLLPDGAALLDRASRAYRDRYGEDMSPAALAGFSAGWALFADVLPHAASFSPADVADAARAADLPLGSLPNGSGLRFGAPNTLSAGDNLAAASVIWEWVRPGHAAVVWPPSLATHAIEPMDIT